jgi:hypothetical protein
MRVLRNWLPSLACGQGRIESSVVRVESRVMGLALLATRKVQGRGRADGHRSEAHLNRKLLLRIELVVDAAMSSSKPASRGNHLLAGARRSLGMKLTDAQRAQIEARSFPGRRRRRRRLDDAYVRRGAGAPPSVRLDSRHPSFTEVPMQRTGLALSGCRWDWHDIGLCMRRP